MRPLQWAASGRWPDRLLGACLLVPLSELLREFGTMRIVFYGLILVICVVALPEGIFHYLSRKYNEMERWVRLE